jgi:hypothetical protein
MGLSAAFRGTKQRLQICGPTISFERGCALLSAPPTEGTRRLSWHDQSLNLLGVRLLQIASKLCPCLVSGRSLRRCCLGSRGERRSSAAVANYERWLESGRMITRAKTWILSDSNARWARPGLARYDCAVFSTTACTASPADYDVAPSPDAA